ncbi:MAG: ABC transporter ATP-binding protein [Oscillospiraceae bacterium]
MLVLETKGLTKTYGQGANAVHALQGVTAAFAEGRFYAIRGRSGSGKSTLLNLLGGLDMPTSGTVLLEGQDLYACDEAALAAIRRRRMGFVFQDFQLLAEYTVRDNILLPLFLDQRAIDAAYFAQIVQALELAPILRKQPWQLSGGQQQRVAVARALIARPAILLADEPTGNLDAQSGQRVFTLLRQTASAFCKTIIFVTHDAMLARQADVQLVIEDGRIVA